MKLLPDQFGVAYPNTNPHLKWDNTTPSRFEIQKYIDASHITNGSLNKIEALLKNEPIKHPVTAWFLRNTLMDDIKMYYRVFAEPPKFNDIVHYYKIIGPQAYKILTSSSFNSLLRKVAQDSKTDDIVLTPAMKEMIENTYLEAKKLEKPYREAGN